MKRSQEKRITQEAIVLRHMRYSRQISLNEAGRKVGITGSAIAHIEQGRMDISRERIKSLVTAYEYTMDDYLEFMDGKDIPINFRDECISAIRQMDEVRLQAVHAILINMMPQGSGVSSISMTGGGHRKRDLTKSTHFDTVKRSR